MVARWTKPVSGKRRLAFSALALLAMVPVACRPAQPVAKAVSLPPRYSVTNLGDLDVTDINDNGQVVGFVWIRGEPENGVKYPPYLWENGKRRPLTIPRGGRMYGHYGVNNQGQIVGPMLSGQSQFEPRTAILWDGHKARDLGKLPQGQTAEAIALNDVGHVVGIGDSYRTVRTGESSYLSGDGMSTRAFLWEEGKGMQSLGTLGGAFSRPYDINNQDEVVGESLSTRRTLVERLRGLRGTPQRAFLWRDGKMQDLGALPGDWESRAVAINEVGQVVGISYGKTRQVKTTRGVRDVFTWRAFLWEKNRMRLLPPLPGNGACDAEDINDRGQVVGCSKWHPGDDWGGPIRATLWQDGVPYDLNTLIPADSGWELTNALGINNRGQIIGRGGYRFGKGQYFLLTPQ
jgi:probable HAF family extracellular repeat protein